MNRIFDAVLSSIVDVYYFQYPGALKRQKQQTGLDIFENAEYSTRYHQATGDRIDLDGVNL